MWFAKCKKKEHLTQNSTLKKYTQCSILISFLMSLLVKEYYIAKLIRRHYGPYNERTYIFCNPDLVDPNRIQANWIWQFHGPNNKRLSFFSRSDSTLRMLYWQAHIIFWEVSKRWCQCQCWLVDVSLIWPVPWAVMVSKLTYA